MGIDINISQCYNILVFKGDYMKKNMSLIQKMNALLERVKDNKKFKEFRKNAGVKIASLTLCVAMFVAGLTSCDQINWSNNPTDTKDPGIITPSTKDDMGNKDSDYNRPDGPDTIAPDDPDSTTEPIETTEKTDIVTIEPSEKPNRPSEDTVTAPDSTDATETKKDTKPVSPVSDLQPYFDTILNSAGGVKDLMTKYYNDFNVSESGRLNHMSIVSIQPISSGEMIVVLKGTRLTSEMLNMVKISANYTDAMKAYSDITKKSANTDNMQEFTDAVLKALKSAGTPTVTPAQPVNVSQKNVNKTLNLSSGQSVCYISNLKANKVDGQYVYVVTVDTYDSMLGMPSQKTVNILSSSRLSTNGLLQEVQDYFAGNSSTQDYSLSK